MRTVAIAFTCLAAIGLTCLTYVRVGDRDVRFSLGVYYPSSVQQEVETTPLREGLWGPKLERLAVAPDGQRLVAIGAEGSFYSDDGGDSFRPLQAEVRGPSPEHLDSPSGQSFSAVFGDDGTLYGLYWSNRGRVLLRSGDGGASFDSHCCHEDSLSLGRDERGVYVVQLGEGGLAQLALSWPEGEEPRLEAREAPAASRVEAISVVVEGAGGGVAERRTIPAVIAEGAGRDRFAVTAMGFFVPADGDAYRPLRVAMGAPEIRRVEVSRSAPRRAVAVDAMERLWFSDDLTRWQLATLGPVSQVAVYDAGGESEFVGVGAGGCVWRGGDAAGITRRCPPDDLYEQIFAAEPGLIDSLAFDVFAGLTGVPEQLLDEPAALVTRVVMTDFVDADSWGFEGALEVLQRDAAARAALARVGLSACALAVDEGGVMFMLSTRCPSERDFYDGGVGWLREPYAKLAVVRLTADGRFELLARADHERLLQALSPLAQSRAWPGDIDARCAEQAPLGLLSEDDGALFAPQAFDVVDVRRIALRGDRIAQLDSHNHDLEIIALDDDCEPEHPSVLWEFVTDNPRGPLDLGWETAAVYQDDRGVHVLFPSSLGVWRADLPGDGPRNGSWLLHRLVHGPALPAGWALLALAIAAMWWRRRRGAGASRG
ncbi:MAG: hypothetical protein Tsb0020_42070 [Haliangiales bacterium]